MIIRKISCTIGSPHRSLGLVAVNQPQKDLILDEMDRVFATNEEAEAFRSKWHETLEPFFVKNLENVQGDERDAIFISTVYGPNDAGRVMQRFGPINSQMGHRRLNVLFTRAKRHVWLFTSMRPEDILVGDGSSWGGVRVLQGYIRYAFGGQLDAGDVTGKEPDSDFEIWVRDRLEEKGYKCEPQVGVSGYFLDLAVHDPDCPGAFILGVECDGATYHSSKSARDRDRLRQEVLEGLGWNIYRIWSTDWFKDPAAEVQRLVEHIEEIRRGQIRERPRIGSPLPPHVTQSP